jgi:hypothetical protein
LTIPVADEGAIQSLDELTAERRAEIAGILNRTYPGKWNWLTLGEVEPHLHAAALRYQQKQAEGKLPNLDPAWQPIRMSRPSASFAEAERYTAAEYTFHEMPYRFQHYISEYLAPDERILYATRRPAMPSQRKRWFRREQLQEGVLILTSQRLIQLVELIPPDSANIRYGFHTSVGALERLSDVTLTTLGTNLLLQTKWQTAHGEVALEWESPEHTHASLDEMAKFLRGFQADADACALRRAAPPPPPNKLPTLTDTASNDPAELIPINERFAAALAKSLQPGEQARAWALLPKWFQHQKNDQCLVVTERRILILPDHTLEIPLTQVATLEYTASILESSLVIGHIQEGSVQRKVILFPYPAQDAFRNCFEAARRCMAVLPLS